MNLRKSFAVVVFLVTFVFSSVRVSAQDDVLIEPPLTWSINSIQIVWSVEQGATTTQETKFIYGVEQGKNETTDKVQTSGTKSTTSASAGIGAKVDGGFAAKNDLGPRTLFGRRINPLTSFGLDGAKASASAYVDGGFNYNQTCSKTDMTQWSETEKNVVSQALTLAYAQSSQQSISNQRLVFTVDFVNHTRSRLYFNPNSANTIPVYIGNIHIGNAHLIKEKDSIAKATIAATGKPIPCQFEMALNDTGKQSLVNNRPIISIEGGQLLIQSDDNDDAVQKSIAATNYFTVAILSDNNVKEWKVRWFRENPVTLQEALEVINENIREKNNDNNQTIFVMKNGSLVSVCGVPFANKDNSGWITQLKVLKGMDFQTVSEPDSCLSETPCRGERYVFQLVNQDIIKLEAKANSGNAEALFELANRYYLGADVPEDKVKAIELLHKAAELGYAEAQNSLGDCYANGKGVEKNYKKAVEWYRKAAEQKREAQCSLDQRYKYGETVAPYLNAADQGLASAQFNLGECYRNGKGVEQNKAEAVKWHRKAAKQGHASAQNMLAWCYENGDGVKQDKSEAIKWYRKAAEQGHATAQNNLGACYFNGEGVKQDKSEAVNWFRKAAEQGLSTAQINLGNCYYNGQGAQQDYNEAITWFRKAAEQGISTAQVKLGNCYYNGQGVSQDYKEAVYWYRKAAEQNNVFAQYNLGQCYYKGEGVLQDYKEAAQWFRKAAAHELYSEDAQCCLASCYYKGEGVPQDYNEAAQWFRKAAENEHAEAQYCLGWCYLYGRGVSMDLSEAEDWFTRAKANGHIGAQRTLSVMGGVKVCGTVAATAAAIIILGSGGN